jgi:hypothetical protein
MRCYLRANHRSATRPGSADANPDGAGHDPQQARDERGEIRGFVTPRYSPSDVLFLPRGREDGEGGI